MVIKCTHCQHPHTVSENLQVWHWHCNSCKKVFDWRRVPIRPVHPKPAAQHSLHTDAVDLAASTGSLQAGKLSASRYDA